MSTPEGGGKHKVSPHVVWASLVGFLGSVGAVSYVVTRDIPDAQQLWISGSIVAPVLGIVVTILQNRRILNKQTDTHEVAVKTEHQTNGALAEQFESLKVLLGELTDKIDESKKEGEE